MSSTDNRIAKAKLELDKAEEWLKSRLSEDQLNNLNAIQKLWNTSSSAFSDYYDDIAKNVKGAGAIFFITEGTNLVVNLSKGQSGIKNAIDVIGSAAVTIASFTPQGRLIMWGNTALSLVGLDVSSVAKKIYDWAMGNDDNTDDYGRKIELINGVLQVTMPDGTVYARPFMPNAQGSLFGNGKDDVLIGGDKKDIFIGHGGNDIFVGKGGKDDYFVSSGDTIIDSDGAGRVFPGSSHQLKGGTQIEKGSKIYKGKDGVKYELKDNGDLLINDSIVVENFSNDNLEIHLSEFDEINTNQTATTDELKVKLQNSQNFCHSKRCEESHKNSQTSHSQQTPQLQNTQTSRHSEFSQESEESHMNSQNIRHSKRSEESRKNLQNVNSQNSQNTLKLELTFTEKLILKDFAHKLYGVKMPEIKQRIGIDAATQCKISLFLGDICEHKRQIVQNFGEKTWQETFENFQKTNDLKVFENAVK